MTSQLITSTLYPFICYLLAIEMDLGINGIAICSIAMNLLNCIILWTLSWMDEEASVSMKLPDESSFTDFGLYFWVGFPNIIIQQCNMLSQEINTIVSGTISVTA